MSTFYTLVGYFKYTDPNPDFYRSRVFLEYVIWLNLFFDLTNKCEYVFHCTYSKLQCCIYGRVMFCGLKTYLILVSLTENYFTFLQRWRDMETPNKYYIND